MVDSDTSRVWRDQDVRQTPERTGWVKRLALQHVQHSAAQTAILKACDQRMLFDNPAARHIHNDCAGIEHCNFVRANQTVGSSYKRRRYDEDVTIAQPFMQLIRPNDVIDERRHGLIQT